MMDKRLGAMLRLPADARDIQCGDYFTPRTKGYMHEDGRLYAHPENPESIEVWVIDGMMRGESGHLWSDACIHKKMERMKPMTRSFSEWVDMQVKDE